MSSQINDHPCGALPEAYWSVSVVYCGEHDLYWAHSHMYVEDGGDPVPVTKSTRVEFGPFDTPTDIQHWVQSQLGGIRQLKGACERAVASRKPQ